MIWLSTDVFQMTLVVCWFELQERWLSIELEIQSIQSSWDSNDLVVHRFEIQVSWLSIDLKFKWFGCQSICDSIDFVCQCLWDSSELVVHWSEIHVIWLLIALRFKWIGCQSIWDLNELVVNWFELQAVWMSNNLRSSNSVVNWCIIQMILSNEAFLRDFLQNWSFQAQKRNFSARLLSKISFGGIPNSSSLMPCLTTWAHSCSAVVLPMRTMLSPKGVQKQSHGCSCQGCKATNPS